MRWEDWGSAAIGVLGGLVLNDLSRPLISVGLTTLVASAMGSAATFAYYPEPNRAKLFALAVANTFFGAAFVVMAPIWFGWAAPSPTAEPAAAFLSGALCRFLIPALIELLPALIRLRLGMPPNGGTPK